MYESGITNTSNGMIPTYICLSPFPSSRLPWEPKSAFLPWTVRKRSPFPRGTQPGDTFTLRGKGVPFIRSGRRGDQVVTARVEIPKSLSEDQKRLFKELADSMGEDGLGEGNKGLFDKFKDVFGNE